MIGYGRIFQFTKESWAKTQKRVFTAHILSCLLLHKYQSRPSQRWTYPEPSAVIWQKMILGCIEMSKKSEECQKSCGRDRERRYLWKKTVLLFSAEILAPSRIMCMCIIIMRPHESHKLRSCALEEKWTRSDLVIFGEWAVLTRWDWIKIYSI